MRQFISILLILTAIYMFAAKSGGVPDGGDPPIPGVADLHVLVVEETQDRHELSPEQLALLTGPQVRRWLEANAADDGDGVKAYRFWDRDQLENLENESTKWQVIGDHVLKAETPEPPWIMVADGSSTSIRPLPESSDKAIEFLEQWAK